MLGIGRFSQYWPPLAYAVCNVNLQIIASFTDILGRGCMFSNFVPHYRILPPSTSMATITTYKYQLANLPQGGSNCNYPTTPRVSLPPLSRSADYNFAVLSNASFFIGFCLSRERNSLPSSPNGSMSGAIWGFDVPHARPVSSCYLRAGLHLNPFLDSDSFFLQADFTERQAVHRVFSASWQGILTYHTKEVQYHSQVNVLNWCLRLFGANPLHALSDESGPHE